MLATCLSHSSGNYFNFWTAPNASITVQVNISYFWNKSFLKLRSFYFMCSEMLFSYKSFYNTSILHYFTFYLEIKLDLWRPGVKNNAKFCNNNVSHLTVIYTSVLTTSLFICQAAILYYPFTGDKSPNVVISPPFHLKYKLVVHPIKNTQF